MDINIYIYYIGSNYNISPVNEVLERKCQVQEDKIKTLEGKLQEQGRKIEDLENLSRSHESKLQNQETVIQEMQSDIQDQRGMIQEQEENIQDQERAMTGPQTSKEEGLFVTKALKTCLHDF